MKVTKTEYRVLEDDPVVIVTYDTGAIRCYLKIEDQKWKDDPRAIRAKILDKDAFDQMFPKLTMPAYAA
jgi:hypothetical protein